MLLSTCLGGLSGTGKLYRWGHGGEQGVSPHQLPILILEAAFLWGSDKTGKWLPGRDGN